MRVWLPTQGEAVQLFVRQKHRLPSSCTPRSLGPRPPRRGVYAFRRTQGRRTKPCRLLLSIFASTAYYWTSRNDHDLLFLTLKDANQAIRS